MGIVYVMYAPARRGKTLVPEPFWSIFWRNLMRMNTDTMAISPLPPLHRKMELRPTLRPDDQVYYGIKGSVNQHVTVTCVKNTI
jgi:hypothetical protein